MLFALESTVLLPVISFAKNTGGDTKWQREEPRGAVIQTISRYCVGPLHGAALNLMWKCTGSVTYP